MKEYTKQKCTKCKGRGWLFIPPDGQENCSKCKGMGEVDWIEQITGVKEKGIIIPPGVYVKEVDLSTFVDKFFTDDYDLEYLFYAKLDMKNEHFKKL